MIRRKSGRFVYNYDESGHLTETTGYSGGNVNWGKQTREKNEYDGDGNRVTWYWQGCILCVLQIKIKLWQTPLL